MIYDLIKDKFGTIDNMINNTDIQISRAQVYRMATGHANPKVDKVHELARVLEIEPQEVFNALRSN